MPGEAGRVADHGRGCLVDDARLFAVRGRTVDLGALFPVVGQHVKAYGGAEFRFAVFLGDLDVGGAVLPGPIVIQRSEERFQEVVPLPRQKSEWLAGPFTFGIRAIGFNKVFHPFRFF